MRFITTFVLLTGFLFLNAQRSFAQCTSGFYFETVPLNTNCAPAIAYDAYAGEYSVFKTPQANKTYEFYSAIATDYLTIMDSSTNTVLVHGVGPLTYTTGAVPPGTFKFLVHTNASCGTDFSPHDRFVRCVSCSATSFPSCVVNFTPPNNSTIPTLSTNLLWNSNANAGSYDIYLATMTGGCGSTPGAYTLVRNIPAFVNGQPNTTTTLTGLSNGTSYRWYILPRACDGTPVSGGCVSNATCFSTLAPAPANDSCVNATAISPGITCTYTASSTQNARDENATGDCTSASNQYTGWFKFVATSAIHTVMVDGSADFDAVISTISACNTTNWPAGGTCTDAQGKGGVEVLNLSGLNVGSTYYIQVYDWFGTTTAASQFDICVSSGPLPIRLSAFNAFRNGKTNQLEWSTESEQNSLSFLVERAGKSLKDWQVIGEVASAGNSLSTRQYAFEDKYPQDISYYRLSMLDRDGGSAYSPVKLVSQSQGDSWAQVSPNPFRNSLHLDLQLASDQSVNVQVIDAKGSEIYTSSEQMSSGAQQLSIPTDQWPGGIYVIKIQSLQGARTLKVMKE